MAPGHIQTASNLHWGNDIGRFTLVWYVDLGRFPPIFVDVLALLENMANLLLSRL